MRWFFFLLFRWGGRDWEAGGLFYFSPFSVSLASSFLPSFCSCVGVGAVSGYEDVSLLVVLCLVFGGLLLAREVQPSAIIVVEGFFVSSWEAKKKKSVLSCGRCRLLLLSHKQKQSFDCFRPI